MQIEKMILENAEDVVRLGKGVPAFSATNKSCFWSEDQIRNWIKADEDVLLVAKENGKIVGFILSTFHRPTGKVTWENLYVNPDYRNKGIGKQLTDELLVQLKQKGASNMCFLVRAENEDEKSYFQNRSFEKGNDFTWFSKNL